MSKITKIISAALVISVTGAAIWLGFSTASTAKGDALKLAWSTKMGGSINLAPEVISDMVLVTPKGGHLNALNKADGSAAWNYNPDEGVWPRSLGNDGERVFVCLKGGGLAALNADDGAVLWKTDLGINCLRPPFFANDSLYVSTTFVGSGLPSTTLTGAKFFSINPADGTINWELTTDTYLLQTAFRTGDMVYVGGSFYKADYEIDEGGLIRIYALDATSGKTKWTYEAEDGFPKALYATQDRLAYVGYDDYVIGLDTATGKKLWRRDTGNWVPSLNGLGDTVYYGSANTNVHAWNMSDGKTVWKYNIPGESFNYMLGRPMFGDGRMYFLSQQGTAFALDLEDGEMLWSQPTGITARAGLNISGKTLFIGDKNGTVYAYDILK